MATHTTDQANKVVTLEGLGKYHHSMVSALGLTQDTGAYDHKYKTAGADHTEEEVQAPKSVKGALDDLYGHTMILCDDAKKYFEAQFHSLFTGSWNNGSGSLTGGTTYGAKITGTKTVTLTATFKPGQYSGQYVNASGVKTNWNKDTEFTVTNASPKEGESKYITLNDTGWTCTKDSATEVKFTKDVEVTIPATDATSEWTGPSFSVKGTGKVRSVSKTTRDFDGGTVDFSKTPSTSFGLSNPGKIYIAQVSNADTSTLIEGAAATANSKAQSIFFEEYVKTSPATWSNGKKTFESASGKCAIFFSMSSFDIQQVTQSIVAASGSFETRFGTYYWKTTGALSNNKEFTVDLV